MFRDNEKRDWTMPGNTTSHMYDHWQDFRPQTRPSTAADYPWQKKRTMLVMHKIRTLWYRGIVSEHDLWLPRLHASMQSQFFDITWCITKMVPFFVQGSTCTITYLCNLQSFNIWEIFNPEAIQTTVVVHWANKKFLTKVDIFTLYLWNAFTKPKLLFMQKFKVKLQPPPQMTYITATIPVPNKKKVKEAKEIF